MTPHETVLSVRWWIEDCAARMYDRSPAVRAAGSLEDAKQEALAYVIRQIGRGMYDPKRGALTTFVAVCVHHVLVQYGVQRGLIKCNQHSQGRFPTQTEASKRIEWLEPESWCLAREEPDHDMRMDVREAMRQLPKRVRVILRLHFWRGMTLIAVSRKLRLSNERVRQLATEGRNHIYRILWDSYAAPGLVYRDVIADAKLVRGPKRKRRRERAQQLQD